MEEHQEHSLGGHVFQKIREGILNGKYKENDELRENTIGKELGVSRTPVREALRQLELAVDAVLPRVLVLDLAGVTFMDSSGIALILRAQQRMRLLDGSVVVRSVPPQARRVLDAAGISRLVTIK